MKRIMNWSAVVLAAFGLVACHNQTSQQARAEAAPPRTNPAVSVRAKPTEDASELGNDGALARLHAGFEECGLHRVPALDGHWVTTQAPIRDVWICEGRIRWTAQWGGVSDICFSKVSKVDGGLDAEGVWHEDLHDPGDASGLYLHVRRDGSRLSINAASWEEPNAAALLFLLERKAGATDQPGMKCPLN
jgi:hypothetical protein